MFRAASTKDGRTVEGMRVSETSFDIVLLWKIPRASITHCRSLTWQLLEKEPGKSFMPSFKTALPLKLRTSTDLVAYHVPA